MPMLGVSRVGAGLRFKCLKELIILCVFAQEQVHFPVIHETRL